ncbi:hypothetical protein IAT38_003040 [Cryptococcus sp. DSM 104549]
MFPGAWQAQPISTGWAGWAPASSYSHHSAQPTPSTPTAEAGPSAPPRLRHDPASAQPSMAAQGGAFTTAGLPVFTSQRPPPVNQQANVPPPPVRVSCDYWRRGPDKTPGSRPAAAGYNPRPKQAKPQSERHVTNSAKSTAPAGEVQTPAPWAQGDAGDGGSSSAGLGAGSATGSSGVVTAEVRLPLYRSVAPTASAPLALPHVTPEGTPSLFPAVVPGLDHRAAVPQWGQAAGSQPVLSTFNHSQPHPQLHHRDPVPPAQDSVPLQGDTLASIMPHLAANDPSNQQHLSSLQQISSNQYISPNQHISPNQQISPNQHISPDLPIPPTQPLPSGLSPHNPQHSSKAPPQAVDADIVFVSRLWQGPISPGRSGCDSQSSVAKTSTGSSVAYMRWRSREDAASLDAGLGQILPLNSRSPAQHMSPVSPVRSTPDGQNDKDGEEKEKWSTLVAPIELFIPPGNIQAAKDGWWSWILSKFSDDRQVANHMVVSACSTFFSDRYIWLDFLQPNVFFHSLFYGEESGSPILRLRAAPHILLAILAHVTLLREGQTLEGQQRAFMFVAEALSLISYCLHAGSQDPSLFAAGLILTTVESQPHAYHSPDRVTSFLRLLDGIGMSVYAHHLDADVHTVSTSLVGYPRARSIAPVGPTLDTVTSTKSDGKLEAQAVEPLWNPNWTQAEMCKEEMRRMCWCASGILANYTLWQSAQGRRWEDFEMSHPDRFRLLFPGEAVYIELGDYEGGKTTPCAMYHRVLSLWHFVMYNKPLTPLQHAQVVNELRAVEEDQSYIVQGGDLNIYTWLGLCWIMPIRQLLGALDKTMLSYWFRNQILFFKKLKVGLPGFPNVVRPLHCWWYILQAYCSIELSVNHADMWDDADQIYVNALAVVDQIAEHWHCEASLSGLLTHLKNRHTKVLKDRQEVIKGKHEAGQQVQGTALALTPVAM